MGVVAHQVQGRGSGAPSTRSVTVSGMIAPVTGSAWATSNAVIMYMRLSMYGDRSRYSWARTGTFNNARPIHAPAPVDAYTP